MCWIAHLEAWFVGQTNNENHPADTTSLDWTYFEASEFTARRYRRRNEGKT